MPTLYEVRADDGELIAVTIDQTVALDLIQAVPSWAMRTVPEPPRWTFRLPWDAKIPNGLSLNDRAHFRAKGDRIKELRQHVAEVTRALPKMERCEVSLEWVVKTRGRRDVDNLVLVLKTVCDGIGADSEPSAHLVVDDDPAHMVKIMPTIRYAKDETPGFDVVIRDLSAVTPRAW